MSNRNRHNFAASRGHAFRPQIWNQRIGRWIRPLHPVKAPYQLSWRLGSEDGDNLHLLVSLRLQRAKAV